MSGGSYNYLCQADVSLEGGGGIHGLTAMVEDMERDHPGRRATVAAHGLLCRLNQCADELDDLRKVFQAVEWRRSGDWGDDDVERELRAFEIEQCNRARAGGSHG